MIPIDKKIRVLTIQFDAEISSQEIVWFRGAVLKSLGDNADLLYHNHIENKTFRYSYPLIQYKRLGGKAAIVCVENGADVIGQYLSEASGVICIGNKEIKCDITKISPIRILVQTWKHSFGYHITRWLPLNSKNYQIYQLMEEDDEKKAMLESILKGNLLSMLKGLGIRIKDELFVRITQLSDSYIIYNKGVGMMAFNADFTCNLSIPNNVGIGKNASIGCGVVHQERKDFTNNQI